MELVLDSETATVEFGVALGAGMRGGEVVALSGPLGAGKTRLVRGLARGLGVPADEPIVSPTFVLLREYEGRLRLYHFDAYRLNGPGAMVDLGWEELVADGAGVVVVEWADRVSPLVPHDACRVELSHVDATTRRARVTWDPRRIGELRNRLGAHAENG